MSDFKIIYRFCDNRILTHYDNITKFDCIYNFIDVFGEGFTIIFDNTSKVVVNDFTKSNRFTIVETNAGNSGSFIKALEIANSYKDDDIVYFVEDDYLHKPKSKDIILEGLEIATFVTLYDHPDKYLLDSPNPIVRSIGAETSKVYLTNSTHWKTTNSTTMTFAARISDIKNTGNIMRNYVKNTTPDDYNMWRELLQFRDLIVPIPGYATHCHDPWICPLVDWKK